MIDVTEILVHWHAGRSKSEMAASLEQLSRPVDRISSLLLEVDRDLVVSDALVPPCQSAAGLLLDDGLLRVVAGECAHIVHAGEECYRGEPDFVAVPAA